MRQEGEEEARRRALKAVRGRHLKPKLLLASLVIAAVAPPATAAVFQGDGLRITVLGQIQPFKLPRDHLAPAPAQAPGV